MGRARTRLLAVVLAACGAGLTFTSCGSNASGTRSSPAAARLGDRFCAEGVQASSTHIFPTAQRRLHARKEAVEAALKALNLREVAERASVGAYFASVSGPALLKTGTTAEHLAAWVVEFHEVAYRSRLPVGKKTASAARYPPGLLVIVRDSDLQVAENVACRG